MDRISWLILSILLGCLFGCSRTSSVTPVPVQGKVLLQNRPLIGGMVVFTPHVDRGNTGKPVAAVVDANGEYHIGSEGKPGLRPGWYRVTLAEPVDIDLEQSGFARFPQNLRRPDRSGIERQILPGGGNTIDFLIEVGQ
jgi:hypothetical protein